jgi:hypothetical protein
MLIGDELRYQPTLITLELRKPVLEVTFDTVPIFELLTVCFSSQDAYVNARVPVQV